MHVKSYLEELQYIRTAVPSWSKRAKLLAATIAFHVNNRLRRKDAGWDGLDLDVLIEGERAMLHVRPNKGDLFILYEVLAREAYAIPASLLDPDKVEVIVDCGANIGITALYFARRYPKARIICVEPDPENFEILERNVAGQQSIEPVRAAVVGSSGPVHLTRSRAAYGNSVQANASPGETVEVSGLTISDICSKKDIERIDLLKVDIEGAEKNVFAAATFLNKVHFVAIELHAPYGIDAFQQAIAPYGFTGEPPNDAFCRHAHFAYRREPVSDYNLL